MQAYIDLVASDHSIGALHAALVQIKRTLPRSASLTDASLHSMAVSVWMSFMQQLSFRHACVVSSYQALQQDFARLPWSSASSSVEDIAYHRIAPNAPDAASVVTGELRRRAITAAVQSGAVIAAAAEAVLIGLQKAAKSVREAFWKDAVEADYVTQIADKQAVLLAMLAQCAFLHHMQLTAMLARVDDSACLVWHMAELACCNVQQPVAHVTRA